MSHPTPNTVSTKLNIAAVTAQPKPAAAVAHGYAMRSVALMRGYTV